MEKIIYTSLLVGVIVAILQAGSEGKAKKVFRSIFLACLCMSTVGILILAYNPITPMYIFGCSLFLFAISATGCCMILPVGRWSGTTGEWFQVNDVSLPVTRTFQSVAVISTISMVISLFVLIWVK